ncbi:MAG: rod shape-determining protein RodA [Rhizobiales bacterium]|nr:rod shape-determining protein RodA [Hyphomicrobiales bacterium]
MQAITQPVKPEAAVSLPARFVAICWPFVGLVCVAAAIGVGLLYSVAGGSMEPWALVHAQRFALALAALIIAAMIDVRLWMRIAYPFYGVTLLALVGVELAGLAGGGAQRWIGFVGLHLQPSEFMKLALVLGLARYYQKIDSRFVSRPASLLIPVAIIAIPTLLVLRQPDLGTAILLITTGAVMLFAAGVNWLYFAGAMIAAIAATPFVWQALHGYQRERVLAFIDPERDPLGAGYHIIQSKIALGSGGFFGKGYTMGTQSQLNFVPEKHTDFIFAMAGEEFGFVGALAILALFGLLIALGTVMAIGVKNRFGRLASLGVTAMLFQYVFVNAAMVTGLVPVVGVPLPLVSYGGSAMVSLMIGFGILLGAHVDRERIIPRPLSGSRRF